MSQYVQPNSNAADQPVTPAVTPPRETPAHEWSGSRFKRVRDNTHIYWPERFTAPHYRGGPGTVIDSHVPLEREWLKGQEYRLEDAPEAKDATPIDNVTAMRALAAIELAKNPPPEPERYTPDAAKSGSQYRKPKQTFKEIEA